jgi:Ca2+-transporting ATPase
LLGGRRRCGQRGSRLVIAHDIIRGLTEADAEARLRTEGPNELPRSEHRTPLRIILEVLREPMLVLLLAGGVIYLALGDVREAIILVVFATLSILITVIQETRTERVLEALRDLTSPRAPVIRNGERRHIAGRDVVSGDLVVLAEGDRVPADAVLVESHDLQTDESLLTGESVPVRKRPRTDSDEVVTVRPGGDDLPVVFSGCLVAQRGRRTRDRPPKGAPEAILDLCHCSPDSRVAIIRFATEMAAEGLRVEHLNKRVKV